MKIEIPLRTKSALNAREHPMARHRRVKAERNAVALVWQAKVHLDGAPSMPCVVTLTRLSPGTLDTGDNLPSALKGVRDEVARQLGINDRDPRVEWSYQQEKGPHAVRIEVGQPTCGARHSSRPACRLPVEHPGAHSWAVEIEGQG